MSSTTADQLPGGSAHHSSHQNTMRRSSGTTSRKSAAQIATQLTAEALLKSKHDRHSKLGET